MIMDRQLIEFTANGQILERVSGECHYSSNKVRYIEVHFDLGTNWSGFDTVSAVWFTKNTTIRTVVDTEGYTIVPSEVLTRKADVRVNLVGSIIENDNLTDRLTTYPITAVIVDANAKVTGDNSQPITPSEYEQFVASVKADADRAEDAKDSARVYAGNALSSAQNALASETNASTSEVNAHTSEVNAKASELNAETYKDQAQTYAQNADISATNAENAKDEAIDARDEIRNMSATATTLPAGSNATASYSDGVLSLGIPKGDKGDRGQQGIQGETGATPNFTIGTVETLEPTEDATATITGTAENPVLNLGIPQGEVGEVSYADLKSLLPMDTASGSIVSIMDGQSVIPVDSLKVSLEPMQDLHGYDKPWSGGAGRNLLSVGGRVNQTTAGVRYTSDDNYIILNGTKNGGGYATMGNLTLTLPAGTYYAKAFIVGGTSSTGDVSLYANDGTSDISSSLIGSERTITLESETTLQFRFAVWNDGTVFTNYTVGIVISKTSGIDKFYPYSNICPISGHTEVVTEVRGVNVWDEEWESGTYLNTNGIKYPSPSKIRNANPIRVFPNTRYYYHVGTTETDYDSLFFYDADMNFISRQEISHGSTIDIAFTTPQNCAFVNFAIKNTTYNHDVSINYPSTDTEYHPYNSTTYTTELEGNYTVVGTDNVPYLFKPVGDIDGDRLREKIVGGSVAFNQLVDHKSKTDRGITATYDPNTHIYTLSGTATGTYAEIFGEVPVITGHKYFCKGRIISNPNSITIRMRILSRTGNYVGAGTEVICIGTVNGKSNQGIDLFTADTDFSGVQVQYFCYDLTQIFGTTIADYVYGLEQTTAGTGVAWLKQHFPKMFGQYNPYDAGSIQSVSGLVSHDVVGFNQWDEEWELGYYSPSSGTKSNSPSCIRSTNFIKVVPNGSYYLKAPNNTSVHLCLYDANKGFLSHASLGNDVVTTLPNNAEYATFFMSDSYGTTYNHDICINISDTSKNGTYEPYQKWLYPLDSNLELRGIPKLNNSDLYYDGDIYEADGTVTRKYGIVDLGTLNWNKTTQSGVVVFYCTLGNGLQNEAQSVCSKYPTTTQQNDFLFSDKVGRHYGSSEYSFSRFAIHDSAYDNADETAFKSAMNGVYLVYELATPITETATPFEAIQKMVSGGTLQYVTDSIVPVGHDAEYLSRVTYGGVVDIVSGEFVVDRVSVNASDLTISKASGDGTITTAWLKNIPRAVANTAISNRFSRAVASGAGRMVQTVSDIYLVLSTSQLSSDDTDGIIEWFAENPTTIVYELATPTTVQLTPTEVKLLLGNNTIWSDGDVAIVYSADVTKYIEKRLGN